MTPKFPTIIFIIFIFIFVLSEKTFSIDPKFETCRIPKSCGDNQTIRYPFHIQNQQQPFCGYHGFIVKCHHSGLPVLELSGRDYLVHHISYEDETIRVSDAAISTDIPRCLPLLQNLSLPSERFQLVPDQREVYLIYNCSIGNLRFDRSLEYGNGSVCSGGDEEVAVVVKGNNGNLVNVMKRCGKEAAVVVAPVEGGGGGAVEEELKNGFELKWMAGDCGICERSGGICGFDEGSFHFKCYCPDRPHAWNCTGDSRKTLKITLGIGVPGVLLLILVFALWYYRKRCAALNILRRNISFQPYSKSDLEDGNVYFEVHVFSYSELEKATNKFDRDKELGDGGFGTVYHGKLPDGREVAVKRLYQQNYRRVEQFMNEVKILTRLRHKNLVSLYGCTSRQSRELLLVYEFIPNGTVADHLHGEQANCGSLSWPIRMNIAIETASALVYLHASDIIHRDVKTNNILLDNNFSVKVADFGLSRLFPNDVSHVSTAPQGTPGYVDPEYYQCYQLTTKSDVYSFGVVLIELISSMPAVDITRHKHEINLSNLAVNKILKQEVDELIDPCLGFQSDNNVRQMITAVAWLAFHCLQEDKERRPTMEEALETLIRIQSGEEEKGHIEDNTILLKMKKFEPTPSPECDEAELLKNKRHQLSPTSVADKWISSASFNASVSSSISSIS